MKISFICLAICFLIYATTQGEGRAESPPNIVAASAFLVEQNSFSSLHSDIATTIPWHTESVPTIKIVDDPIEPMNRAFFTFNNLLFGLLIDPLEASYKFVFPDLVRKRIGKVGYNVAYPIRFLNCLLVGKFKGSGVETGRFLVNTTVGFVGMFDPASSWGMRKYDEDFGKTFAKYGAGKGFYFVMPIFGPSNLRDATGAQLDSLADPSSYVFLNYLFSLNELSYTLSKFKQIDTISYDPYATERYLWVLSRKRKVMDLDSSISTASLGEEENLGNRTLDSAFLRPHDPNLGSQAKERNVRISSTGKNLPYSFILQRSAAPLVFVIPGAGIHRMADSSLAVVEMLWRHGFSVAVVSSALNWEFIENAGTMPVPGYPPADARDIYEAFRAIFADLTQRYPERITSVSALGISVGGLQALFMANFQTMQANEAFYLSRIVAVDPPVDMYYTMRKADEYYQSPFRWGASDRYVRMEMALLKANAPIKAYLDGVEQLPLDETESHYVTGVAYRAVLRDMIYSSQKKHNLGVVKADLDLTWNREPIYDAIEKYSFADYFMSFLYPCQRDRDASIESPEDLVRAANLRRIEPVLKNDPKIRAFTSADEFVLSQDDFEWFRQTLDDRLVVLHKGSYFGNPHQIDLQDQIMQVLDDLKPNQSFLRK